MWCPLKNIMHQSAIVQPRLEAEPQLCSGEIRLQGKQLPASRDDTPSYAAERAGRSSSGFISSVLCSSISMVDPFTLACILAAIAAIIAILFYLFSGGDEERDFEKAFGESARKLLSQEREKHKSRVKVAKKKDVKEKKTEHKQEGDPELDKDALAYSSSTEPIEATASVSTSSVRTASPPESKAKYNSKRDKEKVTVGASTSEPTSEEATSDIVPSNGEETTSNSEQILEENKENRGHASTSEGKKRKKSKTKREDDVVSERNVNPEESQVDVIAGTTSSSTKEREKKQKKKITIVNINDLDSNKVLTRIASLEEIEPEYISYLATYFHDTNAKVNNFEHALQESEKKATEYKKKFEQQQQSRLLADRQNADHVRVISELASKVQTLTLSESACKKQIAQLNEIRLENDTLKSALSKTSADAATAVKATANLEMMKATNAEMSERLSKMTKSLNESVEENASLKRQIAGFAEQVTALEDLKREFAALDMAARQLKAELMEKTHIIEEERMNLAADPVKKMESERDEIAHQFSQARSEWEKKEAALMNEYTSLKNLVDELNKEVAKFEQFKKEQDELEKKLLAKEAELAEKSARLAAAETEKEVLVGKGNDRSAELEKENLELQKKVADLEAKLSKLEKKSQAESMNAAPVGKQEVNDEVMVLERAQPLLTSNETNTNTDELITLRAENERLQLKNEELRKRNFKILDDVAGLEKQLSCQVSPSSNGFSESGKQSSDSSRKQLLEERELVASTIGSLVNTPLKDSSYDEYVSELAKSLKSALRDTAKKSRKDRSKDHFSENLNAPVAKMQAEIDSYRNALSCLADLLTEIESGVEERESFYKDKVASLESALEKA
ncbi:unnamed protein product [Cylicocyclus nassatus]|uniref:Uncharacterized protein n=1 Tax=Cylicocyclus nassatus TaxID=53992 RepID=A0AA36GKE4_CYLNA|nr:unnamed protein product [Cylicocyclus nassatus]